MIPINLELFKILMPIVVELWALIFFLWSRVEHPLRTLQLDGSGNEVVGKLREAIHRKGFTKLEEDEKRQRIKIKGILKIVDVLLYRCWSKEIIFQVIGHDSPAKLVVTCKPSGFRITASSKNPDYLSRESLDHFLEELTASR